MAVFEHFLFFREEFFGSVVYNSSDRNYYYFDEETSEALRKILKEEPLSGELEKFRGELLDYGLVSKNVVFFHREKEKALSAPLRVFLDITFSCNLRCKHCFTDSGRERGDELTTDEIFSLMDQMRDSGVFLLSIAGGEPFLRKDIFQILAYAKKKNIDVSITTNALLIDEGIAKRLNDLRLRTITISIDGMEGNHDSIRGKGNFRRAVKNIRVLKKFCSSANLSIKNTVNSLNIADYKEIIELAENLDLCSVKFNPVRLFGRTLDNRHFLLTREQYVKFLQNVQTVDTKVSVTLPKTPLDKIEYEFMDLGLGCTGGKETCNISPLGDFSSCAFLGSRFIVGNLREKDFPSLWDKTQKTTDYSLNETCRACSEYLNCRGGCRSRSLFAYGNINGIDPLCVLKKALEGDRLSVRREKSSFFVYRHSSRTYKNFSSFEEIRLAYPDLVRNGQYREIYNRFRHVPLKIFFDPTNRCNSKCIHCYNDSGKSSGKDEIRLDVLETFVKGMQEKGIFLVSIAGGEPFIREDIFEIIRLFNAHDVSVSITTNGLSLDREKAQLLSRLDVKSVTVSVDGVTKEEYLKVRGVNRFDELSENLHLLREFFSGEISMRLSVMRDNCIPEKVLQYAVDKRFDCLKINKTHLMGRFVAHKNLAIGDEEYDRLIESFRLLKDEYPIELELPREKYLNKGEDFSCSAGRKTAYLSPVGEVLPCPFISKKFSFGNIKEKNFEEILSQSQCFSVENAFCMSCPAMKKSHNISKKVLV